MRRKGKRIGIDKICAVLVGMALFATCLSGCGDQIEGDMSQSGIEVSFGSEASAPSSSVDIEALLQAGTVEASDLVWSGAQYVDGKAVTVWRGANAGKDFVKSQDIYIKDANNTLTKVVTGAPGEYTEEWYYTLDGHCFAIFENKLIRIEADGTETYKAIIGADIQDICRLESGQLLLVIKESSGNYCLADVDEATGEFKIVEGLDFGRDSRTYIAEGENGLLLLNSKGLWNVNVDAGELIEEIPMSEYDIKLPYTIKDFRMLGAGSVEFLKNDEYSEVIHPKDISKYREVVTVQCRYESQWLKAMLKEFNNSNRQYYAVLEPLMVISDDGNSIEMSIPYKQWEKEIANGGGADLIEGDCIADFNHYIDEGYLENLTPYMEQSGMELLDYFPTAFELGKRGENIYIANLYIAMSGLRIWEEILGNRAKLDVETLVDKLLDYTEPSVLNPGWDSEQVVHYLLAGSEDLHGIIDWEEKTCDFRSDFFYKVLEASLAYGDDGSGFPAVGELYTHNAFYNYIYEERPKLAEEVYLGFLFDDGCYPWMTGAANLVMNSNSQCKKGAWAVLEYLLSEEAQTQKGLTDDDGKRLWELEYPVNVHAFEAVVLLGQEEIRELIYEVRYMPDKPEEILEIVYEEAQKYFDDERSLGDTCEIIQKRAQEYLDGYEE